jgi:hypothetical protein
MESDSAAEEALQNPSNTDGGEKLTVTKKEEKEEKPKLVVIMGPTGSGKSKLAIDLAAHFPVEIINADSMQVYRGLDVLTNKVPISDQEGLFSFFFYMLIFVVLTSSLSKWRSFFYITCNLQTSITAMNFLFFTYNNNKKS